MAKPLILPDIEPDSMKSVVVRVKSRVSVRVDTRSVLMCAHSSEEQLGVHYFQTPDMLELLITQSRFERDEVV